MSDFISISCTKCGSPVVRESTGNTFICSHCETRFIIKNTASGFQIERIIEAIKSASPSLDITNAELAIPRLKSEIIQLNQQRQYWSSQLILVGSRSAAGIIIPIFLLVAPLTGGFCLAIVFAALVYDSITKNPVPWIFGLLFYIGLNILIIVLSTKPKREIRKKIRVIDEQIISRQMEIEKNLRVIYKK